VVTYVGKYAAIGVWISIRMQEGLHKKIEKPVNRRGLWGS
jgi:hypothetical protein